MTLGSVEDPEEHRYQNDSQNTGQGEQRCGLNHPPLLNGSVEFKRPDRRPPPWPLGTRICAAAQALSRASACHSMPSGLAALQWIKG